MRPDDMIAKAIKSAAEAKVARAAKVKVTTLPAQYMGTDSEGKGWVMLPGANGPTPVRRMAVEAKAGDTVAVTVGYGRAVVDSNISNPSAGVAGVTTVRKTAQQAQSTASQASKDAQAAIGYATTARAAANDARSQAGVAAAEAQAATGHAQQALSGAQTAQDAATRATADAATASEMAAQATASATAAGDAAAAAQEQAGIATTAANNALVQLAEVEDVMGTVEWIAEHGTYELTTDTQVDDSKVYYERTGSGTQADPWVYTAIPEPTEAGLSGYYELHVDQAVSQYVSTHLALTDAGLYVLADANGYKLLLANTGMSVVDPQGHVVVTYGESITAASDRPFSIGNEDAYVLFTPATATAPAKVVIGGNVELGSGKTLSEWIDDIERAVNDSSAAVQAANDVPIVTLSSTNGTVFKRNLGVSTTIVATIFTPGGRIDNAAELHRRFGNGAYLEWGWRDVVTDAMHVIVSGDPRIGSNGFTLTVDPEDIDVQAVITCSLNY